MKFLTPGRVILRSSSISCLLVLAACSGAPKPTGLKDKSASGDGLPAYCADYAKPAAAFRLVADQDATYSGKVKAIIDGKCAYAGCHVAGVQAPDLSTFQLSKDAGLDIIQRAITDLALATVMPTATATKGATDAASREILQAWADKGFPETYLAPVTPPPPAAVTGPTYTDIAALMTAKTCGTCHSTAGHQSDVILDTEAGYNAKAARIPEKLKAAHVGLTFDATQLKLTADYASALAAAVAAAQAAATAAAAPVAAATPAAKEIPAECLVPQKNTDSGDAEPKSQAAAVDSSDFSKVLKPLKLTECHDKGVLYDRRTKDCHVATLGGDFDCKWDGIKTRFAEIATPEVLQKLVDDKWQVDQCGMQDGNPVVFLIQADSSGGFLNLAIKVLSVE